MFRAEDQEESGPGFAFRHNRPTRRRWCWDGGPRRGGRNPDDVGPRRPTWRPLSSAAQDVDQRQDAATCGVLARHGGKLGGYPFSANLPRSAFLKQDSLPSLLMLRAMAE